MPINTITGTTGADARTGTGAADLITGFAQGGSAGANLSSRIGGFSQPVFATAPPDDSSRLFIVEKPGAIRILDLATNTKVATPFLDLTGTLGTAGEEGLLGLAFDPDFAANGNFYVFLSRPDGDSEIRRYHVNPDTPGQADPASAELVLRIDTPDQFDNHRGGWIGFGPDGKLYAAVGDGGGGGDPLGNAQNTSSLLGKMLRIDVHGADAYPADPTRNYAIPADNPFAAGAGADEIFAYGLRNPWRNSFDRGTGDFYIADVGQGAREEIDLGANGANYGWNLYEGPAPYLGGPAAGLTAPIYAYDHTNGDASITGGYVYRGQQEGLFGSYLFADFVSDRVWALTDPTGPSPVRVQLTLGPGLPSNPASFGEDAQGNLYILDIDGDLFRVTPTATTPDTGADTLDGAGGDDNLFGGGGNDLIAGGSGADYLSGMAGDDRLDGGEGADRMLGGDGADSLQGGTGGDHLLAGAGADVLDGGTGPDTMAGGDGDDQFVVRELGDIIVEWANTGAGADSAFILASGYTLPANVEIAYLYGGATSLSGSAGAEQLVANAGFASVLAGGGGGDTLWSTALADTLDGGAGDDILRGQGGADRLTGGAGNDQFVLFDAGTVVIEQAGGGTDTAWVAASGWTMGPNIEIGRLSGAANSLFGSAGDEQLVANAGLGSVLRGADGNDTLWGSGFADTMNGGAGDDILYSIGGADRFVFAAPGWGFDQISGFDQAAGAKIALTGLGTDYATISAGLTFGGGNTQINFGADRVLVYGVTGLEQGDFIF